MYSSLSTIHKTLINKSPPGLVSYFRIGDNNRKVKILSTKYIPTTAKMNKFYIYKYTKIYNSLDQYVRDKSIKGFKNEIKHIIRAGTINDTMDWCAAPLSIYGQIRINDIAMCIEPSSYQ